MKINTDGSFTGTINCDKDINTAYFGGDVFDRSATLCSMNVSSKDIINDSSTITIDPQKVWAKDKNGNVLFSFDVAKNDDMSVGSVMKVTNERLKSINKSRKSLSRSDLALAFR